MQHCHQTYSTAKNWSCHSMISFVSYYCCHVFHLNCQMVSILYCYSVVGLDLISCSIAVTPFSLNQFYRLRSLKFWDWVSIGHHSTPWSCYVIWKVTARFQLNYCSSCYSSSCLRLAPLYFRHGVSTNLSIDCCHQRPLYFNGWTCQFLFYQLVAVA